MSQLSPLACGLLTITLLDLFISKLRGSGVEQRNSGEPCHPTADQLLHRGTVMMGCLNQSSLVEPAMLTMLNIKLALHPGYNPLIYLDLLGNPEGRMTMKKVDAVCKIRLYLT